MIHQWRKHAAGWIEERLRRMCGAISPDKRVFVAVILFLLFAALSIYSTVTAIYRIGRGDGQKLRIKHIRRLETPLEEFRSDSPERQNAINYE